MNQYCDLEVPKLASPYFSGGNRARGHLRSVVQLWLNEYQVLCRGMGGCLLSTALAASRVILSNLHPMSGNWISVSLVLPPLLPSQGNGDFERLNILLRIRVAPGVESSSDFKAYSLIVHIPYSQAVSEASRGKACFFPTEVNVGTTIALGFLRLSCENWILEYEG